MPVFHAEMMPAVTCPWLSGDWKTLDQSSIPSAAETDGYVVRMGWNNEGLCVFVSVKDEHPFLKEDGMPWDGDGVELFFARIPGRFLNNFNYGNERLQIACSAPYAAIRTQAVLDWTFLQEPLPFYLQGAVCSDGYELRMLVPWDCLHGVRDDGYFRFQFSINDFQQDGQKVSHILHDAPSPSGSSANYVLCRLCKEGEDNPRPSLDMRWNPVVLADKDGLTVKVNKPGFVARVEFEITDFQGNVLAREKDAFGTVFIPAPPALGLWAVFHAFGADGVSLGGVMRKTAFLGYVRKRLALVDWNALSAWETAWWLTIVATEEFILMALDERNSGMTLLDDAIEECEARLAIADNKPLPQHISPKFRFLELARGFQAQLNVSYSRNGWPGAGNLAVMTVPWGNLPAAACVMHHFPEVELAENFIRNSLAFADSIQTDVSGFDGAERAVACRGWALEGCLPSDFMPERMFAMLSRDYPNVALKLAEDELEGMVFDAISIGVDAPSIMVEKARTIAHDRNLPEIDFKDCKATGRVLVAGRPPFALAGSWRQLSNGLKVSLLFLRIGGEVFMLPYHSPAHAEKIWRFMMGGSPITHEIAEGLALSLAESLRVQPSGDCPNISRIRVGDVHTHTNWSDGQATPLGLMANAPTAGLDYLVISDHNVVAGALRFARHIREAHCAYPVFPGIEITFHPKYHLNVYPVADNIDQDYTMRQIRDYARSQNAVLQLNHPMSFGTQLADLWYDDITRMDFDAVERNVGHRPNWERRHEGRVPASTGSSDTHNGLFGNMDCTVILADKDDMNAQSLRNAVKASRCAMLDSFSDGLVYGNDAIKAAVAAALRDTDYPNGYAVRLKRQFEHVSIMPLLKASIPFVPYSLVTRPPWAAMFESEENLLP